MLFERIYDPKMDIRMMKIITVLLSTNLCAHVSHPEGVVGSCIVVARR
jgi:hypothetical protein